MIEVILLGSAPLLIARRASALALESELAEGGVAEAAPVAKTMHRG